MPQNPKPPTPDEPMLSVAQVAKMLAMSPRWVRIRCASGEIYAVRLCGDGPWRIYPDGLRRVLKSKAPLADLVDRTPALRSMARQGRPPVDPRAGTSLYGTCRAPGSRLRRAVPKNLGASE